MMPNWTNSTKFQLLITLGLLASYGFFTSFYKIEPAEKGVLTRFGKYLGTVEPGPHFRIPFGIDKVYRVDFSRIHEESFGLRKDRSLSAEDARLESLMLTGDLKVAVVEWILQYQIIDPKKKLFSAVNVPGNIRDISISVMRRVVGDKLVTDVLTTDRIKIAMQAKKLTQEILDKYDLGIEITNLNLQNVTPPPLVRAAFNEVNIAKQEKDEVINRAKGTYNHVIPEAEGKAAQVVAQAEAYAISTINKAKGDAEKFRLVMKEYTKSPEVTRKRLFIETMEEILQNVDSYTLVDKGVSGVLPIYPQTSKSLISKAEETK
jgi:membrane protease subunit HflK